MIVCSRPTRAAVGCASKMRATAVRASMMAAPRRSTRPGPRPLATRPRSVPTHGWLVSGGERGGRRGVGAGRSVAAIVSPRLPPRRPPLPCWARSAAVALAAASACPSSARGGARASDGGARPRPLSPSPPPPLPPPPLCASGLYTRVRPPPPPFPPAWQVGLPPPNGEAALGAGARDRPAATARVDVSSARASHHPHRLGWTPVARG